MDCGEAERELRAYTLKYLEALEDLALVRQQLKAERERSR